MIISRTPLRISFSGGGTDLKEFYSKESGSVTSTAINRYIYITINKKFDHRIRVSYSSTEIVDHVDELKHDLVREAMKYTGVDSGIEITSIADIPSRGTGLGSSSSFLVGLLNALYAYKGEHKSAELLAKEACDIEINIVGEPIGKQDQYIASYGGFQHIQFISDESVFVDPIICLPQTKRMLKENLILFYTGITRKAKTILDQQKKKTNTNMKILQQMKEQSKTIKEALNNNDLSTFGKILHQGWECKCKLADTISNDQINNFYNKSIEAGAEGGKILGAGGGGFLLLYCPKEKHNNIREALKGLDEIKFDFEPQGSKIIYVG